MLDMCTVKIDSFREKTQKKALPLLPVSPKFFRFHAFSGGIVSGILYGESILLPV
jgi:hypothetical protein